MILILYPILLLSIFSFENHVYANQKEDTWLTQEDILTPLNEEESELISDVVFEYQEDITFDCLKGGWSGIFNQTDQSCHFKKKVCTNSKKILCNPKFYGENVCTQTKSFNHKNCFKAAEINKFNKERLFEKLYSNSKGDLDDEEFELLAEVCAFNYYPSVKEECSDFLDWTDEIGSSFNKIEYVTNKLGESKNLEDQVYPKSDQDSVQVFIDRLRNEQQIVTKPLQRGISSIPTDETLKGFEVHEHVKITIDNGEQIRSYLLLKRDYALLEDANLEDISLGESISVFDPLLKMKLDLTSALQDPLATELKKCLEIIQVFFQNKINLKEKKWQDFLKLQSKLTLNRLAWSYMSKRSDKSTIQDTILKLIKEKLHNPKWKDSNTQDQLSESYSDKFNALAYSQKNKNNFLVSSVSLLSDIIKEQEKDKTDKIKDAFTLKVSDVLMLEILSNTHKEDSANLSNMINNKYKDIHSSNEENIEILLLIKNISKKFDNSLSSIVATECIKDQNLVCKLHISKDSILKSFMKSVDKISARAISGIMQRLDIDESVPLPNLDEDL